jgi:hypothetical protein
MLYTPQAHLALVYTGVVWLDLHTTLWSAVESSIQCNSLYSGAYGRRIEAIHKVLQSEVKILAKLGILFAYPSACLVDLN